MDLICPGLKDGMPQVEKIYSAEDTAPDEAPKLPESMMVLWMRASFFSLSSLPGSKTLSMLSRLSHKMIAWGFSSPTLPLPLF